MNKLRQVILLTLTLLLLVSSTGLSVGVHICDGKLEDLSFFGAEADCPMDKAKQSKPACHTVPGADDIDCCDDHLLVFEQYEATSGSKDLQLTKLSDLKFLAAFHAVVLQLFSPEADVAPAYALYKSPPIARDIPVLVQSFLL